MMTYSTMHKPTAHLSIDGCEALSAAELRIFQSVRLDPSLNRSQTNYCYFLLCYTERNESLWNKFDITHKARGRMDDSEERERERERERGGTILM